MRAARAARVALAAVAAALVFALCFLSATVAMTAFVHYSEPE